jgi:DNA repair photolyase
MPYTPALAGRPRRNGQDAETPLFQALPPALPVVERVKDHRRLLNSGPLAPAKEVLTLQFAEGNSMSGAGTTVRLVENVAKLLAAELDDLPWKPRAVFVSPSTDPFPPLNEIQNETSRIVEVLAQRGIEAWFMTRGYIRPAALDVLGRHANHIKLTMGITTLDRSLQRLLEPLTAPPRLRLRNLAALRKMAVACQASLEPLIPGVTDTRENLWPLLEALAGVGVRHITVGYLILEARTEEALLSSLLSRGLDGIVIDEYARGLVLKRNGAAPGRYLPRLRRQHGYAALMAMAASFGIRVTVNALTNPDFAAPRSTPLVPNGLPARLQLSR